MKVKNVMFSGVMAAILMSVAGTASAAIPVASKGYVDAKAQALVEASAETLQASIDTKVAQSDYDTKVAALESEDVALNTAISNMDAAYQLADQNLQASIDTKVAQTAYDSKVAALESKDVELNTAISNMDAAYKQADQDLQASINTKVAQSDYNSKVAELAGAIADVKELTGTENVADQIATALNTAAQDATTKANAAKDAAIADAEAKNASLKTDLEGQIAAAESYVDQKVSDLENGQVKANKEAIAAMDEAYQAADTALDNKITNMGSAYEAADTALDGKISAMDEAYKAADIALDGKITDMDAAYKQADAQVLNSAKAYTDELKNGAVKANTEAIEALDTTKVAQSEYDAKVQALEQEDSQLADDLARKIEMPAACENTDCVLAYNTSTKTVSWTPLTEPTDEWLNK